jgi:hypothetical protein
MLERHARDKHSSLQGPLINYDRQKYFTALTPEAKTLSPGACTIELFTAVIVAVL